LVGDLLVVAEKRGRLIGTDLISGESAFIGEIDVLSSYTEDGLLGFAFHPEWPADPRVYIHTTVAGPQTAIRELTLEGAFPTLVIASDRTIFAFPRGRQGHNGGQVRFGPDGALYAGFGDGGGQRDPDGEGHDPTTWPGSMARIDVDTEAVSLHAHGFRNPWRFAFDTAGRMLVADVGQGRWEEVNVVTAGDHLGWSLREGRECFDGRSEECETACADGAPLVDPVYSYPHADGLAIIGGVFGTVGALDGRYVFGDNASGRLWALDVPTGPPTHCGAGLQATAHALGSFNIPFTAFASSPTQLLVAGQGGTIWTITPR
jgi:glucose/arabinose dehydrogenase